ncbi:hypothetical protein Ocin01_10032 [Orchesella cincta]|uniref:Uncharacterized protein n=1 Tax=Orchesella cincta TaxID=48709 RepID=A0A1D2MUR9_ORCCI|nr:hypothetical protein Ocin01_10032 [Orchesella cincta]
MKSLIAFLTVNLLLIGFVHALPVDGPSASPGAVETAPTPEGSDLAPASTFWPWLLGFGYPYGGGFGGGYWGGGGGYPYGGGGYGGFNGGFGGGIYG